MEILIGNENGDARERQTQQTRDERDRAPLAFRVMKATARDTPAAVKQEENGCELPQQRGPGQGQVREPHRIRDYLVKDCGLKLEAKKLGVVRKERRIQVFLNCGKIEGIILKARMVAHHQNSEESQCSQESHSPNGKIRV